jgi:hypothetical protein
MTTKLQWYGQRFCTAATPHGAFAIEREVVRGGAQYALYIDVEPHKPRVNGSQSTLVAVYITKRDAQRRAQALHDGWERDAEHESACDSQASQRGEE